MHSKPIILAFLAASGVTARCNMHMYPRDPEDLGLYAREAYEDELDIYGRDIELEDQFYARDSLTRRRIDPSKPPNHHPKVPTSPRPWSGSNPPGSPPPFRPASPPPPSRPGQNTPQQSAVAIAAFRAQALNKLTGPHPGQRPLPPTPPR